MCGVGELSRGARCLLDGLSRTAGVTTATLSTGIPAIDRRPECVEPSAGVGRGTPRRSSIRPELLQASPQLAVTRHFPPAQGSDTMLIASRPPVCVRHAQAGRFSSTCFIRQARRVRAYSLRQSDHRAALGRKDEDQMAHSLAEIEADALGLPAEDRARLALQLLASLEETAESPEEIEKLWIAEAEQRFQELRDGAVQGIPAQQVFAELRTRLSP